MKRRSFLLSATGLFLPTPEPVRRYFFAPTDGWIRPVPVGLRLVAMRGTGEVRWYTPGGGIDFADVGAWLNHIGAVQAHWQPTGRPLSA